MKKINVTKTYLPPRAEYERFLKKIWRNGWITNHGPLVGELENKLKRYFGVKHLFFVANGTIALQIAIKALGLKDKVITTPFSYIATTSSLVWENCSPVFADIEPATLTIDPAEIEKKITPKTTGIMATHVFGNPCDVRAIGKIAKKNNLKLIYDAAHAFGVNFDGKSLLKYGDISILSFHATKLFHTVEGGALLTDDDAIAEKIRYMRNFGHSGKERPEELIGLGINGKNTEFHAAMGLCILPRIKTLIERRKKISRLYDKLLKTSPIARQQLRRKTAYNYAYYPVIFKSENHLLDALSRLKAQNIFPRRYFFPSLNRLEYVLGQTAPISEDIAKRIACLPIYHDLNKSDIEKICKIINKK